MLKNRIQQLEQFQAALKQSQEAGSPAEVTMVQTTGSSAASGEATPLGKYFPLN